MATLPTYDFSEGAKGAEEQDRTPTPKHDAEYDAYMQDVHALKEKVDAGRATRKVDPNQPAFSDASEILRQTKLKQGYFPGSVADRHESLSQSASSASKSGGPSSGDTKGAPPTYDFSETQDVPSKKPFHPHQILDALVSPVDPQLRPDLEARMGRSQLEWTDPGTWTDENIVKSLIGTAAEGLTTPINYLLSPIIGSVSSQLARKAAGTLVDESVKQLTPDTLKTQLAERELDYLAQHQTRSTQTALQTGAFPDQALTPQVRRPTGNTIGVPDLSIPEIEMTGAQRGGVERGAKGRFGRFDYPALRPGMEEPGGQIGLPGISQGYPAEGAPTGKYILTPEEQVPQGMSILRPQTRLNMPTPVAQQETISQTLLEGRKGKGGVSRDVGLKGRVLTPEMEKTLESPLPEQGPYPIRIQSTTGTLDAEGRWQGGPASIGPQTDERFVLPNDLTSDNTLGGAVFPSFGVTTPHTELPGRFTRVFGSITDTMRAFGPVGNKIADLVDTAYSNRAMASAQDMLAAEQKLNAIFPRAGRMERMVTAGKQLLAGENGFIRGGQKTWGYDEKIEEQIFNDMYTSGRMRASDPRAAQAADILFQHGTYPASSDPGVRSLPGVKNPFTGKFISFGEPTKFMPQQPVHPIVRNAISDKQWEILYNKAGGESLGISQSVFRDTIIAISKHDPEVTAHKMMGLENMRLLDLEALGGSPYQWAKKLGYETDPFRAAMRFNSVARLRGQLAQIQEPVNQLRSLIPTSERDANDWLGKAVNRAMLNPGQWDASYRTMNELKGLSHLLDVTMLQLGGLANMAQAAFPVARGGLKAGVKGTWDMLTKTDRALVERSGSLFPSMLNELTNPTGPMATFSSGAFRLYGLANVDRNTRYFAGHVGNQYIKGLEKSLLKNPSSLPLQRAISELGGDPKALLQSGAIPDQMRLGMIQRFANHTAGVTDVRGVPLWASSENPWARLVHKYRTFATANSAEVRRLIVNAPSVPVAAQRVATLLAGAYVVGGGIHEARQGLHDMLMGNQAPKTKSGLVRHAERLAQGLGTIEAMFILNAARDPERAMLSATAGPAGGKGAGLILDMVNTVSRGPGWHSLKTLSHSVPVVGPVVGPLVDAEAKRENKARQAQKAWSR